MARGSSVLKIVTGDTLPYVVAQIIDTNTGAGLDISLIGTSVRMRFREKNNEETTIFQVFGEILYGGSTGWVRFKLPDDATTDLDEGSYEGEVSVSDPNGIQTAYSTIPFRLRKRFVEVVT